jgi:SAM-dependent methyltransferase
MQEMPEQSKYDLIEEDFNQFLDQSLDPRGPELLYELVAGLPAEHRRSILDLGCGRGRHSIELARRFAAIVHGVDPGPDRLAEASRALGEECGDDPGLRDLVRFVAGSAEDIPLADGSIDVVWCRDVLCLVEDLERAYSECRRVLRDGGRVVVYQMFATERLEPREAAEIYGPLDCVASSMVPDHTELAIESAGLRVEDCIVLGSEWGEFFEEASGKAGRLLLHAGRLLRDPDRYVRRFGLHNYEVKLADCLWHVYRLVGKLSSRIYFLSAAARP